MLNAQPAESRSDDLREGSDKVDAGDSIAIVPLTIPLLTGPATISTMVIYAEKTRHWWELAVLVGYGVVIGLAVWLAFGLAGRIARVLGRTGINVMTRLMGLLLAALAVEVMSDGLVKLFPVLADGALTAMSVERPHLRLHRLRRRHRRLPARQPAERRPRQARAADRGRRQRRLPLDPHPGRLPVLHRQPAHRLALRDRARRRA